jgi:Protein of unknown function (DUF3313)
MKASERGSLEIPDPPLRAERAKQATRLLTVFWSMMMLTGCAVAPLERSGGLSSYADLSPADGMLTKAQVRIDREKVLAARSVTIVPTTFSAAAERRGLSEKQRTLVANVIDRTLCADLTERFRVVPAGQHADLTIHAVVTHLNITDKSVAAASKVASIVPAVAFPNAHVMVPRIPLGLGSLSIEAEARAPAGEQQAAIVWARGANSFTNQPRISEAGDAYDLASDFGDDFSKLLVSAANPFDGHVSLPAKERIDLALGKEPEEAACKIFGRGPGVLGMLGAAVAMPPEWTDNGPAQAD